MAKRGRPPTYTEEDRAEIIAHVLVNVAAGRAVTTIFAEDNLPCDERTFWKWHFADEELGQKLVRAREYGVEARLEQAAHVARTPMIGEEIEQDADGEIVKVKKGDMLGHRKLLVETLIRCAQMLKPKTYGPKLDLTSGGEKLGLAAELEAARKRAMEGEK